jgi:hypothetical protein
MSTNVLAFLTRNVDTLRTAPEWAYQFGVTIDWKRWDNRTTKPSGETATTADDGSLMFPNPAKMGLEVFVYHFRAYSHD